MGKLGPYQRYRQARKSRRQRSAGKFLMEMRTATVVCTPVHPACVSATTPNFPVFPATGLAAKPAAAGAAP